MRNIVLIAGAGFLATLVVVLVLAHRDHDPVGSVSDSQHRWQERHHAASVHVESQRAHAQAHPASSLAWERLAAAHLERARLLGSLEDVGSAELALARAFAAAPAGAGPHLARARWNLHVHRLADAARDVDAAAAAMLVSDHDQNAIAELRAQIAWQSGRTRDAQMLWTDLATRRQVPAAYAGLALIAGKAGNLGIGLGLLRCAETAVPPADTRQRAWLRVQAGLLHADQDQWTEALARYEEADSLHPAWPMVREHRAEALAELGRTKEALAIYQELVAQTGDPLFCDSMAQAYTELGRNSEASQARLRAALGWDAWLERYPEAASGHAVAHLLATGKAQGAVNLARRNAALRPYGGSFALLAEALRAAGSKEEACIAAGQALALGWRTPSMLTFGTVGGSG